MVFTLSFMAVSAEASVEGIPNDFIDLWSHHNSVQQVGVRTQSYLARGSGTTLKHHSINHRWLPPGSEGRSWYNPGEDRKGGGDRRASRVLWVRGVDAARMTRESLSELCRKNTVFIQYTANGYQQLNMGDKQAGLARRNAGSHKS